MAIYLEFPPLNNRFPFLTLLNEGDILTAPHWHKEPELIYVEQGVIHMGIGSETIEAKEGEFVLIAGGRVHYVLASPGSIRYVYQFKEQFFYDLLRDECETRALKNLWKDYPAHSRQWDAQVAGSVKKLLLAVYEEDQNQPPAYTFAVKGYLCLMVLEMYRSRECHQKICSREHNSEYCVESNDVLDKLDLIFHYVEEHYMDNITLEDIADTAGFDKFYFAKFFKKNTGKTFLQFLNEYRVEKAKWILINETSNAGEISERAGFGSTKTYYRKFKEIVGITPKQFRTKSSPKDNI